MVKNGVRSSKGNTPELTITNGWFLTTPNSRQDRHQSREHLQFLRKFQELLSLPIRLLSSINKPTGQVTTFHSIRKCTTSGWPAMVKQYGDWFTYDHSPRANIFRRDHATVKHMDSMTKLMRYNNYQHDELSKCNCTPPYSAENAISARCDLNPANGTYPFGALGHRSHGATDMKITNSQLVKNLQFLAVSGPTYDSLPPFQWSKSGLNDLHEGHPDLWTFKPHVHLWSDK